MKKKEEKKYSKLSCGSKESFGSLIFPTVRHILHVQLKSDQTLIRLLKVERFETDLRSSGKLFQMFVPEVLKLFLP